MCRSKTEGGLGIRKLKDLQVAAYYVLAWDFLLSKDRLWVSWFQNRYALRPSYWNAVPKVLTDPWCEGETLLQKFGHRRVRRLGFSWSSLLSSIIIDGGWNFDLLQDEIFRPIKDYLHTLPVHARPDKFLWDGGDFNFKKAWKGCRTTYPEALWSSVCWGKARPRWSIHGLLLFQDRLPTMYNLQKRKVQLAPKCSNCLQQIDTKDHVFVQCPFAMNFWSWLKDTLGWTVDFSSIFIVEDLLLWFSSQTSTMIKTLLIGGFWSIWQERNRRLHGHSPTSTSEVARNILFEVFDVYNVSLKDII
ncbi:uncharacterized protein LOC132277599 [Cornus florida]|uniref:uncharacterized protein LOC132277599 n=1 Tax=Cornus florida TaxID=4283 RepID=UPI00289BAC86|nr:uncharacterized protein LOC132277599 [Cornus florida]